MARVLIAVLLAAFLAVAAGEIGSCILNLGDHSQGAAAKHCYQCQWDCLSNTGCTSMEFDGRTTGRASLMTYDCGDGHWTTASPGICVLVNADGVAIDTQEQGCAECTHQCKYWGDCAGIFYNYVFASKDELDGFCALSPAPVVPPTPSPAAPVPPTPSPAVLPPILPSPTPVVPSPSPAQVEECGSGTQSESGGQGTTTHVVTVGQGDTIDFGFQGYTIPDHFTLYDENDNILYEVLSGTNCGPFGQTSCLEGVTEPIVPSNPGPVEPCGAFAGAQLIQVNKPFAQTTVKLVVDAPCVATGYDWSISCATSAPSPSPVPPPSPVRVCTPTSVSESGGSQGTYEYELYTGAGPEVEFSWNAFTIPDQYTVLDENNNVLFEVLGGSNCGPFGGTTCLEGVAEPVVPSNPGPVQPCGAFPGAGSTVISKPPNQTTVKLVVNAPCVATGYDWSMGCADD